MPSHCFAGFRSGHAELLLISTAPSDPNKLGLRVPKLSLLRYLGPGLTAPGFSSHSIDPHFNCATIPFSCSQERACPKLLDRPLDKRLPSRELGFQLTGGPRVSPDQSKPIALPCDEMSTKPSRTNGTILDRVVASSCTTMAKVVQFPVDTLLGRHPIDRRMLCGSTVPEDDRNHQEVRLPARQVWNEMSWARPSAAADPLAPRHLVQHGERPVH